jgi:hypothetical protein
MSEESARPPFTSCSERKAPLKEQKKRTYHVLQNRTILFTLDRLFSEQKFYLDTAWYLPYSRSTGKAYTASQAPKKRYNAAEIPYALTNSGCG